MSGPGNFTGESCEHVKAHVVLKHLSCFRTQGKKEILQISFIKDLDIKPDQDYTKRKKEKKKERKKQRKKERKREREGGREEGREGGKKSYGIISFCEY